MRLSTKCCCCCVIQGAQGDTVEMFKLHFDGIGGDKDCIMQVLPLPPRLLFASRHRVIQCACYSTAINSTTDRRDTTRHRVAY
jgi:hypothetical protein